VNIFFTLVFIAEAALKLVALGIRRYFTDMWNNFDMFIVVISIIGCVFDFMGGDASENLPINPTILRILRILRVARILKLLKRARNLMLLLDGVKRALPQVSNLCVLLLLTFFIFATMGVELFGRMSCTDSSPCDGLSKHANFENFGIAMLTLFRISTGDNWAGIMKDTLREPPLCDDSDDCETNCCASTFLSPIYFTIFCLTSQFVLLNIVVAVMMEQLEASIAEMAELDKVEKVTSDLLKYKFIRIWSGDEKEAVLAEVRRRAVEAGIEDEGIQEGEAAADAETAVKDEEHCASDKQVKEAFGGDSTITTQTSSGDPGDDQIGSTSGGDTKFSTVSTSSAGTSLEGSSALSLTGQSIKSQLSAAPTLESVNSRDLAEFVESPQIQTNATPAPTDNASS